MKTTNQSLYKMYKSYVPYEYEPFTKIPKPNHIYEIHADDIETAISKMEKDTGLNWMKDKICCIIEDT